jgi:DNA-binding CsgD family transcriptional regulator
MPPTTPLRDQLIVQLHSARTTSELVPALFAFASHEIVHHASFLVLRPIEFELPSFCSRPEFQFLCDDHISGSHTDDIWLQRSPVDPSIPVVRHSDFTPQDMFRASSFYRRVMIPSGSEYGLSLVAWKQQTWLSHLTIFRTAEQGDFRDDELERLHTCHTHFRAAAVRVAEIREKELGSHSLETFIWNLPTAVLVLDWSLKVMHHNSLALDLCRFWRFGPKAAKQKRSRTLIVPGDLMAAIEKHKADLKKIRANSPASPKVIPFFEYRHPNDPHLIAKISFLPSKSLAVTKGTFLMSIERHGNDKTDSRAFEKFANLTRRERDVALLAAKGLDGPAIGRKLGTAPITVRSQLHTAYRKLGIKTRHELITLFAKQNLVTAASIP